MNLPSVIFIVDWKVECYSSQNRMDLASKYAKNWTLKIFSPRFRVLVLKFSSIFADFSLRQKSSVKFPRKIGYPISSDLPTLLYPILSDFREPTYPPNHRISYVDGPLHCLIRAYKNGYTTFKVPLGFIFLICLVCCLWMIITYKLIYSWKSILN